MKYESEWYADAGLSKWNELDRMLKKYVCDPKHETETDESYNKRIEAELKPWQAEKEQRIKKLLWWDKIDKQGFPKNNAEVWHLHPVGLVENFAGNRKIHITLEMLKQVYEGLRNTTSKDEILKSIADEISNNSEKYKLDTPLRISHFFAQVRVETGDTAKLVEGFNYSPEGLISTFGYFSSRGNEAQLYGRTSEHPANQQAIANRAYGGRYENGDISSGDGWRFRGRGLKQLTFRYNYRIFDEQYFSIFGEMSPDFLTNPDRVGEVKYAIHSAVFFWLKHALYLKADNGATDNAVNSITAVINQHTRSYPERRQHFHRIWDSKIFHEVEK